MTNVTVVVQCTVTTQTQPEGVELKNNRTWKSPPGGWLSVQQGKWIQDTVAGVVLKSDNLQAVGMLHGLIFDTAQMNDSGVFRDDGNGGAGAWKVVATTP